MPGTRRVEGLGVAAHNGLVVERTFGPNCVGDLVDLSGERLRAAQTEDVIDVVLLAEGHRLGAGVVTVAPEGDGVVGQRRRICRTRRRRCPRTSMPLGV